MERSAACTRVTTHVQPESEESSETHRVVLQTASRILAHKRVDFRADTDTDSLFSRGVSDHVAGRRLGRPSGHFAWSLTPRDAVGDLRQWRHQAGGTVRRPRTTARNLRDDLQLPYALAARECADS